MLFYLGERCTRSGSNDSLEHFPIRIDDDVEKDPPAWAKTIGRTRHIGDFSNWKDHDAYQKVFDRLIRDLRQERSADKALTPDT